jgi:hypothetical protein
MLFCFCSGTLFGRNGCFDDVLADTHSDKVITTISSTALYCREHIEAISLKFAKTVLPAFVERVAMDTEIQAMERIVKQ